MIEVYFIRHAATKMNGMGYIALEDDCGLDDRGIIDAKENVFKKDMFDNVYVSPTKRTIETSKIIYPYKKAKQVKFISQKIQGELNNHLKSEYEEEYLIKLRNYDIIPEGAETLESVISRLDKFFDRIVAENKEGSRVLVITHNGIMRIISKVYGGLDYYLDTKNLDGFIIKIYKNKKTKLTKIINNNTD